MNQSNGSLVNTPCKQWEAQELAALGVILGLPVDKWLCFASSKKGVL